MVLEHSKLIEIKQYESFKNTHCSKVAYKTGLES